MVTGKLYGRIGNQMFQIAAIISYGLRHNMRWYIPKESDRPVEWPCYFSGLTGETVQSENFFNYKEPSAIFQEIPYYPNIRLDGYFQSEKYFAIARQPIINAFNIPWKLKEGVVSIHVRRGDYLNHPEKHPVISEKYLADSIQFFLKKKIRKFIFFSDDIEWCRNFVFDMEHFITPEYAYDSVEIEFADRQSEITDIALMSNCEHHIISNSSFSWWAAWLGQNRNKIVIAPKIWTNVSRDEWNTSDICPEEWIRI